MIVVKNGYTLNERAQQEYAYQYQAVPTPVQREISAPAVFSFDDGEGNVAYGLRTLQGTPVFLGLQGDMWTDPIYELFFIDGETGFELTAIDSNGNGNYYIRYYAEYDGLDWYYRRSHRLNDGEVITTAISWFRDTIKERHPYYFISRSGEKQNIRKNNHDNKLYSTTKIVEIELTYGYAGEIPTYLQGRDYYLSNNNYSVLLSSQSLPHTDYLYTVTGGIVTS